MTVQPVLGDWAIPRISRLESLEQRRLVELEVPGRAGSLLHDLERRAARFLIAGSLHGREETEPFLTEVRSRFLAGEPLTFVADILTATDVEYVVIERLEFAEDAAAPEQLTYLVVCTESPPPPPPPSPLGALDAGLLDQAAGLVEGVGDALAAIDALAVPDFGDPTQALGQVLDGATAAMSTLDAISGPLADLFGEG